MGVEGSNDGATPQEQQTEAQQQNGNGCNDGTAPQEQQTEAQQQNGNDCNGGTTPQEQQQEAQDPEGNDNEMYLLLDDESDYIKTELDNDTVSNQEHHRKRNFISIRQKIEIAEAAVRGKTALCLPFVVWHGKTTYRAIKFDVISNHCQN